MRFTISREKLQEGLSAVAASVPTKTTLPVLANILVEATEKGIRLSGTDLDIAVTTEVAADVETPGAITIPAKKLNEIARELPPLQFASPPRVSNASRWIAAARTSRFSDFRATSFLHFRMFASTSWRIRSGDLQKLISHTSFAVSTEESRPILNGVLWELKPDMMRMVATNGHRLAKMEMPIKSGGAPPCGLIVHTESTRANQEAVPGTRISRLPRERTTSASAHRSPAVFTRLIGGTVSELRRVMQTTTAPRSPIALRSRARCAACRSSPPIRRIALRLRLAPVPAQVQRANPTWLKRRMSWRCAILAMLDIGFNANYLFEILRYSHRQDSLDVQAPSAPRRLEPEVGLIHRRICVSSCRCALLDERRAFPGGGRCIAKPHHAPPRDRTSAAGLSLYATVAVTGLAVDSAGSSTFRRQSSRFPTCSSSGSP
jgi:DNA polymerase-3 subunit beta